MPNIFRLIISILTCLLVTWHQPAVAAFPDRPVTIVVTYSAGGEADVQIRIVARYLEKEFGVPFVIRNVVGASGQTGWDEVARGKPDGYTWVNLNLPQIVTQPAVRDTVYKTDSFECLILFREQATALAVRAENKSTLAELVEAARKQPGKVTIGVGGKWTQHDLGFFLFEAATKANFAEVDIDGQAELNRLLLGGHVQGGFGNVSAYYRLGDKVRVLAVASKTRTPELPNVPTFEEAGFPGVVSQVTMGLGVAKGTPSQIVESVSARLHQLFKTNETLNKDLEKAGGSPWFLLSREESIRYIREKRAVIVNALKDRGIKVRDN